MMTGNKKSGSDKLSFHKLRFEVLRRLGRENGCASRFWGCPPAVERQLQIINPLGRFSQGLTDLTSGEGFPGNAEELATGLTSCISGEGFPGDPKELATGLAAGPSSPHNVS